MNAVTAMDKNYITMLGTGNALATRCYNTCFVLHSCDGTVLMVDAGGGNPRHPRLPWSGLQAPEGGNANDNK